MHIKQIIAKLALIILLTIVFSQGLLHAAPPPGSTTVPYTLTYTAKLKDAAGVAITTAQSVRFSLWSDSDYDASDLDGAGNINVFSAGYAGWQETHTITPNAEGIFTVELGTITTFPNFNQALHRFLQVEVKPSAAPNTSFENLDPDGNPANTTDRKPFNSTPYTINADTVDNHDVGFGAGDIPYLNVGALLDFSLLPGGVNQSAFVIDNDNTTEGLGTGSIILQFGNTLAKFLEYSLDNSYFNFNDNVNITGDLTVSNSLIVNGVPVGPYNQSTVYEPIYSGAVIEQSGGANRGKLESFYVDSDGSPGNANLNYYQFSSRQVSLQNITLVIRHKIPEGFVSFSATPIQFDYSTQSANVLENVLDVSLEDTAGNSVALSGASGLVSTTWATANITFAGVPVFTPGQEITIKIKLSADSVGLAKAGKLKLNFNGA